MPPEITKSAPSSARNERYSTSVCPSASGWLRTNQRAIGAETTAVTIPLLRLLSQKWPAASGMTAIARSKSAKGRTA